jgi:OHCU decarboxylase
MRLAELNALDENMAAAELRRCCGSSRWAKQMAQSRPFDDVEALTAAADSIWWTLDRADWLEAFAAHPRIGAGAAGKSADEASARSHGTAAWSDAEQAGVSAAGERTRRRLVQANEDYQARFGYIFIVCATGRTGDEMLDMLEARLCNDPDRELRVAVEEQRKITRLRLAKLVGEEPDTP